MKDSLLLAERAGKEFRFPIPDVMPRSSGEDEAPFKFDVYFNVSLFNAFIACPHLVYFEKQLKIALVVLDSMLAAKL